MGLTFIIHYTGKNGDALKFVKEMTESGIVGRIRSKESNLQYQYYESFDDKETIILIDSWKNQEVLDLHNDSTEMQEILKLRKKYNLSLKADKYIPDNQTITIKDQKFINM